MNIDKQNANTKDENKRVLQIIFGKNAQHRRISRLLEMGHPGGSLGASRGLIFWNYRILCVCLKNIDYLLFDVFLISFLFLFHFFKIRIIQQISKK